MNYLKNNLRFSVRTSKNHIPNHFHLRNNLAHFSLPFAGFKLLVNDNSFQIWLWSRHWVKICCCNLFHLMFLKKKNGRVPTLPILSLSSSWKLLSTYWMTFLTEWKKTIFRLIYCSQLQFSPFFLLKFKVCKVFFPTFKIVFHSTN